MYRERERERSKLNSARSLQVRRRRGFLLLYFDLGESFLVRKTVVHLKRCFFCVDWGSNRNNIASRETGVMLALAMYSQCT